MLILVLSGAAEASVTSFKVWRAQKIHQATQSMRLIQNKVGPSVNAKIRLKQAKTNVSIAHELTPNDYFILYLAPKYKTNKRALEVAARFLSREELAQILVGYSRSLQTREEGPRPSFPPVLIQ